MKQINVWLSFCILDMEMLDHRPYTILLLVGWLLAVPTAFSETERNGINSHPTPSKRKYGSIH